MYMYLHTIAHAHAHVEVACTGQTRMGSKNVSSNKTTCTDLKNSGRAPSCTSTQSPTSEPCMKRPSTHNTGIHNTGIHNACKGGGHQGDTP